MIDVCHHLAENEIEILKCLVNESKLHEAIQTCYNFLDGKLFSDATPELLYLKRNIGMPIDGADLVYFKNPSSYNEIITNNIKLFSEACNKVLKNRRESGVETPDNILENKLPTLEDYKTRSYTEQFFNIGMKNWKPIIEYWEKEESKFTTRKKNARYRQIGQSGYRAKFLMIDIFQFTNIFNIPEPKIIPRFWVNLSEKDYNELTQNKKFRPGLMTFIKHVNWGGSKREPSFLTIDSFKPLREIRYSILDLIYTGKQHSISNRVFYEVNLVHDDHWQYNVSKSDKSFKGNVLIDNINEILYEAENQLRIQLGLPKIGMGWVSETNLYNLVKQIFPDTVFHYRAKWLNRQHIDIFIPSRKIGIEYQGEQHFKPIDFFGGVKAYEKTIERDIRKQKICSSNGVELFHIRYDEDIKHENLLKRIGLKK